MPVSPRRLCSRLKLEACASSVCVPGSSDAHWDLQDEIFWLEAEPMTRVATWVALPRLPVPAWRRFGDGCAWQGREIRRMCTVLSGRRAWSRWAMDSGNRVVSDVVCRWRDRGLRRAALDPDAGRRERAE